MRFAMSRSTWRRPSRTCSTTSRRRAASRFPIRRMQRCALPRASRLRSTPASMPIRSAHYASRRRLRCSQTAMPCSHALPHRQRSRFAHSIAPTVPRFLRASSATRKPTCCTRDLSSCRRRRKRCSIRGSTCRSARRRAISFRNGSCSPSSSPTRASPDSRSACEPIACFSTFQTRTSRTRRPGWSSAPRRKR